MAAIADTETGLNSEGAQGAKYKTQDETGLKQILDQKLNAQSLCMETYNKIMPKTGGRLRQYLHRRESEQNGHTWRTWLSRI